MVDIKKLRENPDYFRKATADKNREPKLVDEALALDDKKRALLQKVEWERAERNKISEEIAKKSTPELLERAKIVKAEIEVFERELADIDRGLINILWKIPNPALPNVPVGKDESENVEIKKWGEMPKFDFPVKSSFELGESLNLIDIERASKVSGTRFRYLLNEGALLELALVNLGLKFLLPKGFVPILPPEIINKEVMAALGYDNYGFENTYCFDEYGFCLVATAEHAIVPFLKDEVLKEEDLPKRFVGFSAGFRKEAGSYGKETKGLFRVHQFNKLEMVSFVRPEDSEKELEFLLSLEEELMQQLKLPYHVVQMCTGDLGDPAVAKYDIEAWFPSEERYRETHSVSNVTDYQSRRLNIKFKRKSGETEYVHILNGTVFSERPILAILENYQQADGSVKVPEVLKDYLGKDIISPK
jgi:seryl-tRNA synthetase